LYSIDSSVVFKRNDDLKNKLREELKEELGKISSGGDGPAANPAKAPRKNGPTPGDNNERTPDTTDYFELVYECVHTRKNFLNVITLNSRNPVEPDIDLVILQALLNGK
jgi:hypothetical protein